MAQYETVEQLTHDRQVRVIDFMRWDSVALGILIACLIISVTVIFLTGFNWGLDFTGGTVLEIHLSKPAQLDQIRTSLADHGYKELFIQHFGISKDILIRIPPTEIVTGQDIGKSIMAVINQNIDDQAIIKLMEFIGPSVGSELAQTGAIALFTALICILIYVGFRFEWRLAAGIVISLAHDVLMTLGIVSFFHIEVNITIIASLMSVIGYSLNDSIVVSDRIRENFRKIRSSNSYEIVNMSLTQTWNRTMITSGISLLVVLMLYFFGGSILQGFSLVMLIGVTIGTISSIYVASALALKMGMNSKHFIKLSVEKEGADQYSILP